VTNDLAYRLAHELVTVDAELEGEFEARVADSLRLAFRIAFSVLRHREDAEDVAQEALARAVRSLRQLRDRDRFRAWLVRLTWRLALNRQRTDRRRALRDAELSSPRVVTSSAVETILTEERVQQLWEAIDALPEKLRIVTILAAIEGHDIAETARLLRLPEGTVKSRLFLGRKRLKDALGWTRTR
jgi:RNA polymerase sigma-70 factor, ECF subfamily